MMSTIYFASPLFPAAEQGFNRRLRVSLVETGHHVVLSQEETVGVDGFPEIYERCVKGIKTTGLARADADGSDADAGTAFEIDYNRAMSKPILAFPPDFRQSVEVGGANLMFKHGATGYIDVSTEKAAGEVVQDVRVLTAGMN